MRSLIFVSCAVFSINAAVAGQTGGQELFDKATGVAVTLPSDWDFFVEKTSLRAASADRRAVVVMMVTDQRFEQELLDLEDTVETPAFTDVEIEAAVILVGDDLGALQGAVAMHGSAIRRKDSQPVQFAATLVKSGYQGELIFGAWETPEHGAIVQSIIKSVRVRLPEMESGLQLTDKETGATITIPDQWSAYATRTGLFAFDPERRAMTLIIMSDEDFDATRREARAILTQRVFTDIRLGDFGTMTAVGQNAFGRILVANGTARDRMDGAPAEFMVVVAEHVDAEQNDRGVLVVGAWKDEEHKDLVKKTLESLRIER